MHCRTALQPLDRANMQCFNEKSANRSLFAQFGRQVIELDTPAAGGTLVQVKGRTLLLGAPQRSTDQLMAIAASSDDRAEASALRKASISANETAISEGTSPLFTAECRGQLSCSNGYSARPCVF